MKKTTRYKEKMLGIAMLAFITMSVLLSGASNDTSSDPGIHEINDETNKITPSSDDDHDGIDDDVEDDEERDVQVEISGDEIQIESHLENKEPSDEIHVSIAPETEGLKIELGYNTESSSSEIELEFDIQLKKLVEFIDDNNNTYYDDGDLVLNETTLENFQGPNYIKSAINDGTYLHYIIYQTTDTVFTAHIYIAEEYVNVNGTLLQPMQMKIDIEILNYNYSDNNSQLALEVSMHSESEHEREEETEDEREGFNDEEEEGLKTSTREYTGYFSWSEKVMVDGVEKSVFVGPIGMDGEAGSKLYLTYPRGNHIFHDPKIGIELFLKVFDYVGFIVIVTILALLALFGLVMSKEEYRSYLLTRVVPIKRGPHRLTIKEVLDNENRSKILDMIIDEPGIHYKELLRISEVSPSNLAWHLDILETYKIIHKARVGHFLVYYPYLDKNPFANFDPKVAKSKTTLEIFQLIGDNPGMMQSQLARRMELDHKTVKYHLEKLKISQPSTPAGIRLSWASPGYGACGTSMTPSPGILNM
ncbi:MAG: winged helix-turn-helix transcriptional regulator, partial [Candidatus Hodarchaeota archaeon]